MHEPQGYHILQNCSLPPIFKHPANHTHRRAWHKFKMQMTNEQNAPYDRSRTAQTLLTWNSKLKKWKVPQLTCCPYVRVQSEHNAKWIEYWWQWDLCQWRKRRRVWERREKNNDTAVSVQKIPWAIKAPHIKYTASICLKSALSVIWITVSGTRIQTQCFQPLVTQKSDRTQEGSDDFTSSRDAWSYVISSTEICWHQTQNAITLWFSKTKWKNGKTWFL